MKLERVSAFVPAGYPGGWLVGHTHPRVKLH